MYVQRVQRGAVRRAYHVEAARDAAISAEGKEVRKRATCWPWKRLQQLKKRRVGSVWAEVVEKGRAGAKKNAHCEARTHDLGFIRPTLFRLS